MGISENLTGTISLPNAEQQKVIQEILQEDKDKFEHQLDLIYKWIETLPHFPKNHDKGKVINFLRASKYDLEKCKRKLELHYYMRHEYANAFSNINPQEVAQLPIFGNCLFLPHLSSKGERALILGIHNADPDLFDVNAYLKYSFMSYDLVLKDKFPVTGDVVIMDGNGFTMKHFLKCINTAVKDAVDISTKAYAVRLNTIYVINTPPGVDKMLSIWKMLLSDKMKERVLVSKTYDILQKDFPPSALPEEYGGTLPKLNELTKNWYNKLVENEKWFQELENCKTTERPQFVKADTEKFGAEGSFRKLTLD